jgi:hypothetical protein
VAGDGLALDRVGLPHRQVLHLGGGHRAGIAPPPLTYLRKIYITGRAAGSTSSPTECNTTLVDRRTRFTVVTLIPWPASVLMK